MRKGESAKKGNPLSSLEETEEVERRERNPAVATHFFAYLFVAGTVFLGIYYSSLVCNVFRFKGRFEF